MRRQLDDSRVVLPLTAAAGAIAVLCVVGYALGQPLLMTPIPGGNTMRPNTALGLLALSVGLAAARRGWRRSSLGGASLALALGAAALGARALGQDDAFDRFLWPAAWPGKMAAVTAVCLCAVGVAELGLWLPTRWLGFVQGSAALSLALSLTALVSYSAGLNSLLHVPVFESIPVNTAVAFALLSFAVLAQTPGGPITRPFIGASSAATLGRRLLVAIVALPWLLGLLVLELDRRLDLGPTFAVALTTALTIGALVAVVSSLTSARWRLEQDLGVTLDSIGDAVLLTDAQGRVQRLNPVAEQLTGWPLALARGQAAERVFNIVNEQTREKVDSPVARVLREGATVGLANHTVLIDRQGGERPIDDSGAPVRGPGGELQGVVLVFRDMTAEAKVRGAMERTAANLRAVIDANPVGLLAVREGLIVDANPALVKLLGFERSEQLLGRPLLEFIAPDEEHSTRARGAAWAQGQVPAPRRLRMVGPGGERLVDSHPLPTPLELDGLPAHLVMVQLVSDREGLERRLARRNTSAFAAAELSGALAEVTFDLDGILHAMVRLVARSPDEVALVQRWSPTNPELTESVAMHAEDPKLMALAQRFGAQSQHVGLNELLRKAGQALTFTAEEFRRQASPLAQQTLGESVPAHLALVPMRGRGQILGAMAVARYGERLFDADDLLHLQDMADRTGQAVLNAQLFDEVKVALEASAVAVTQLRATEAQLRHSQKLEALGQLAGGVAHDFNNLLSVVLGLSSMLLERHGEDDPERADLLDIQAAGERAAELTRQLLAFSRKQVMQLQALDVNAVVLASERIFRRLLGEDVTLELQLTPNPGLVRADPTLLTQVMMNLVVNARDAMPHGGRLTVRTLRAEVGPGAGPSELPPGEYLRLEAEDQGTGVSEEVREHLFEPFYTTKARGKGTGLGLSTSYGIARQSGGTMSIEGQEGQGAIFVVWLPLMTTAGRTVTPAPQAGDHPVDGVILLVEDEPLVREVAQRVLTRAGYVIHTAESAEHALTVAATLGPIDLLLTDVVMPGRSGRELADELTRLRPGLPVLFMSGYTEDAVVQRGVHEGQMALLQKPFTPSSLVAAVGQALSGKTRASSMDPSSIGRLP